MERLIENIQRSLNEALDNVVEITDTLSNNRKPLVATSIDDITAIVTIDRSITDFYHFFNKCIRDLQMKANKDMYVLRGHQPKNVWHATRVLQAWDARITDLKSFTLCERNYKLEADKIASEIASFGELKLPIVYGPFPTLASFEVANDFDKLKQQFIQRLSEMNSKLPKLGDDVDNIKHNLLAMQRRLATITINDINSNDFDVLAKQIANLQDTVKNTETSRILRDDQITKLLTDLQNKFNNRKRKPLEEDVKNKRVRYDKENQNRITV